MRSRYDEDGAGPRVSFGRAIPHRLAPGFYGRLEAEYFVQRADEGRLRVGPVTGVLIGLEGWGSEDGGGAGLPMTAYAGFRQPLWPSRKALSLFGALGLGFDLVMYDRVHELGGFGIFSPFASLSAGFDLGGLRILADGGVQYRWQWGAPDRSQFRLGGIIGMNSELWDG